MESHKPLFQKFLTNSIYFGSPTPGLSYIDYRNILFLLYGPYMYVSPTCLLSHTPLRRSPTNRHSVPISGISLVGKTVKLEPEGEILTLFI